MDESCTRGNAIDGQCKMSYWMLILKDPNLEI